MILFQRKKSLWFKIVAIVCVVALCLTSGKWPTMQVEAAAANVTSITINEPEGITFIDEDGYYMSDEPEGGPYQVDSAAYRYQYSSTKKNVTITPVEGSSFPSSIVFYAEADVQPVITWTEGEIGKVTVVSESSGEWKITVQFSRSSTGDIVLNAATGTPQYTVAFPSNSDEYTIQGELANQNKSYSEGDIVNFTVQLKDTETKELSVKVNGVTLAPNGAPDEAGIYSYTISDLKANTTITISAIDKTFTVDAPEYSEAYTYVATGSTTVTYGGSFSFYVSPAEGYENPEVSLENTGPNSAENVLTSVGNNLYVISNITNNITIKVTSGAAKQYDILFNEGTGYSFSNIKYGTNAEESTLTYGTVEHNGNVTFAVTADPGYTITRVTSNTKVLEGISGVYTIENVTEAQTISVAVQEIQYEITLNQPEDPHYTLIEGVSPVKHGGTYTFYVTAEEGYEAPTVTVGDKEVSAVNGQYIVTNITSDTEITIKNGAKKQQTVTFNAGSGYSFVSENGSALNTTEPVEFGQDFSFKIELQDAYDQSTPVVTVNSVNITSTDEGVYTISNITEDKVVSVSGVQKNTYTVTLVQDDGYTLSTTESTKVTAGDTFTFGLTVSAGYNTDDLVVKAGDDVLDVDDDGYYRFEVKGDTRVTVSGISAAKYSVDTSSVSNATIENAGNTVNGQIPYNGSYQFTVEAAEYYQIEQVAIDGVVATAVNGVYTINNITDDSHYITVTANPIPLTIHYVDEKYGYTNDVEYTIEDMSEGSATVETREYTSQVYLFAGWLDESGEVVSEITPDMIEQKEITLKASWEPALDYLKGLVTLSTTGSEVQDGSVYVVTFETLVQFADEMDEEYAANVRVTGYGILYSPNSIDLSDGSIEEAILKDRDLSTNDSALTQQINSYLYNYFINKNVSPTEVDGNSFMILKQANKAVTRYGAGWLELTIDGQKVLIISNSVGVDGVSNIAIQ